MSFMRLPKCPYCGKKLSYRETWRIRKYGDYDCDRCHQEYKIRYSRGIYLIVLGLLALEVFIFFSFDGIEGGLDFFSLFLMVAPLMLLYPILPLMMSLRRKRGKGPRPASQSQGSRDRRPAGTRIYDPGTRTGQGYATGRTGPPQQRERRPRPPRPEMEPVAQNRPMERPVRPPMGPERSAGFRPPMEEGRSYPPEGYEPVRGQQETDQRRRSPYRDGQPIRREQQRPPEQRTGNTRPPENRGRRPDSERQRPPRRDRWPVIQETAQKFFTGTGRFFQRTGSVISAGILSAGSHLKTGAIWVTTAVSGLWSNLRAKASSDTRMRGRSPEEENGEGRPRRAPYESPERSPRHRPAGRPNAQRQGRGEAEQGRPGQRPPESRGRPEQGRPGQRPPENRGRPEQGRSGQRPPESRERPMQGRPGQRPAENRRRPEPGRPGQRPLENRGRPVQRPVAGQPEAGAWGEELDIMKRVEADLENRSEENRYRHRAVPTSAAQRNKGPSRYRDQ